VRPDGIAAKPKSYQHCDKLKKRKKNQTVTFNTDTDVVVVVIEIMTGHANDRGLAARL
jgi:hypothetical protein